MTKFTAAILKLATFMSGLSAGLSLSHVLEIPGKHDLAGSEFVHVQHSFYGGYAIFGAITWILASIAGLIGGFAFNKIKKSLALYSFMASVCFIISLAIYFLFLDHYNQLIAGWTMNVPAGWQTIRNHWEVSHSIVFILNVFAFIFFLKIYGQLKMIF